MNFLAHLALSPGTAGHWVGSLLPDLVRVRDLSALHPEVAAGVVLHRRIDAATDTHPVFVRSKARLFEAHGRYSGILVDVLYDHALSATWEDWHDTPLDTFIDTVHAAMTAEPELMPEAVRPIVRRLRTQDWLRTYATDDGLRLTFERMSARFTQRFQREVDLTSAVETLQGCRSELIEDFRAFYPDMIALAVPPGSSGS